MHVADLHRQFSQHGKVKFIVIARSPCNLRRRLPESIRQLNHTMHLIKKYKKDIFLLRFEELCDDIQRVANALNDWTPGLGLSLIHI